MQINLNVNVGKILKTTNAEFYPKKGAKLGWQMAAMENSSELCTRRELLTNCKRQPLCVRLLKQMPQTILIFIFLLL